MKVPISLICCTHNGNKKIPKLINSIIKNNYQPKEIIICGTSMNDIKNLNKKKNFYYLLLQIKYIKEI
jgi:GT2 family glycosyltransferase